MKCKYEHDGDCCNSGATQYMSRCKWPCGYIMPLTNGDLIRAMNNEELAEWISNGVSSDSCDYCEFNNGYCDGAPCRGMEEEEVIAGWLKQPAEESAT